MKKRILYCLFSLLATCIINPGCSDIPAGIPITYHYIEPAYQNVELISQGDSLRFPLGEFAYNAIGSFNYFTHKGKAFIAFYDLNNKSLNTYDFTTRHMVHKIPLKKWFISENFKKVSTYVVNFDSIFVTTDKSLFLVDSSGFIRKRIALYDDREEKAFCTNEIPAVLNDSILYMGVRPSLDETSLKAHKRWRVLCSFNLRDSSKKLYYPLPEIYQKNLFGYSFLDYSFCRNEHGHFVFSFPADSTIYETDLAGMHNAYFAKSQFQKDLISPIPKEALGNRNSFKEYCLRYSYGSVFYDPYHKRYLREAKQKIDEKAFLAKDRERKRSILIFDEHFKIIGETVLKDKMVINSIFFTPDGGIYIRVKTSDEQAINFARLDYQDISVNQQLTQNK